jgi:hypothetical protein
VEYAAGLLGINVDCTELLRAGESTEEEASAASRVLAILKKRWEGRAFTTRDVVKELEKATAVFDDGGAGRAAELADALGELIGKALENPTARSVGKLFQRHLTNRPAWIDDGNCVAVLRKISGDRANEYKIEIPGQPTGNGKPGEAENVSARESRQKSANGGEAGEPWRSTL